ncbi:MAG TPA: cytochrome P450 [Candidatus Angelobacter sp.]|nr:cytochrome P450 [Candidatus Angelobacter sp.]
MISSSTIAPVHESRKRSKIPKGPSILHFIRNRKALIDPEQILGVFAAIAGKYGDVVSFKAGFSARTYLISDPVLIARVMTRIRSFTKYPELVEDIQKLQALIGKGMLATHSDEAWKSHRQSIAGNFSPQFVMGHYSAIIKTNLDKLINDLKGRSERDLVNVSQQTILFSGRIMSEVLSPFHEVTDSEFMKIKHILDSSILEFHKRNFIRRAERYRNALLDIAARLYESYLYTQNHDHFSLIAVMHAHSKKSDLESGRREVLEQILNLIVAGYETTSTTLNWIIYLLATHPAITEKLYQEVTSIALGGDVPAQAADKIPLLTDVIDETMRLYSVLWFNVRYCEETCCIDGHKFVKGSRIMLLPYLANRHPEYYKDPDRFAPDRFSRGEARPVFPFGHGQRVCIGKALAELELRMFVSRLVGEFAFEPVNAPSSIGGVLLQPSEDVVIRVRERGVKRREPAAVAN